VTRRPATRARTGTAGTAAPPAPAGRVPSAGTAAPPAPAASATRAAARVALALVLLAAGCGASSTPTPRPTPTPPPPTPSPLATPVVTPPPGIALIDVPEAGIRIPVPGGWELVGAAALADPSVRDSLAATYPGSARLLAAIDQLGDRAEPVFLAADPSPASLAGPLASNLSVLVSQPSVGGFLLDFVAGFIADGLTEALGATDGPVRDRVDLPMGEAVRLRYALPAGDGAQIEAVAWVIGAPAGTLLVTLMGTRAALGELDPDAIAGAIVPVPGGTR